MPENRAVLDLKYSSYPDRLSCGLYHFKAVGPLDTVGFGTDAFESRALIKAATECAERHCLRSSGSASTSSGFAGHTDKETARILARRELIERDAFLLGWLAGRSPMWLSEGEIKQAQEAFVILETINRHGFKTQAGIVANTGCVTTVVGAILPSKSGALNFGVVLGCAASDSVSSAITSVSNELARAATVLLNRSEGAGSADEIELPEIRNGRSTFEHYLRSGSIGPNLRQYLEESQNPLDLPDFETTFDEFQRSISGPLLNIEVAWAKSPHAQSLFFGKPEPSRINFDRFKAADLIPANSEVMPLP